jgi:hypothetical protein
VNEYDEQSNATVKFMGLLRSERGVDRLSRRILRRFRHNQQLLETEVRDERLLSGDTIIPAANPRAD